MDDKEYVLDTFDNDKTDVLGDMLQNLMYTKLNDINTRSLAHTVGQVVFQDKYKDVKRANDSKCMKVPAEILCDSGAISSNYISQEFFEKIKHNINNKDIIKKRTVTILADDKSTCVSVGVVKLGLWLYDEWAKRHYYTGTFKVMESLSTNIIIGLPALIGPLNKYFRAMIEYAGEISKKYKTNNDVGCNALQRCKDEPENVLPEDEFDNTSADKDLYYWEKDFNDLLQTVDNNLLEPWSNSYEQCTPEELETPEPAQFKDFVAFLGKSREEAINEFKDMLKVHVSEEMRKETDIEDMLLTEFLDVFVPQIWSGIKGIPPLKLQWKDDLPDKIRVKPRPINPRLYESSQKEFNRLLGYMYRKSRSPWAACLVVAPKATKPYIRFCGDYVTINQYIKTGHYTIPVPKNEIHKILGFKIFLDIDMTNAFHQIVLHKETSEKLSIQTPWGQFEPVFMPEGIAPATSMLQETVHEIFKDFNDWTIVIFDNMLILAHDYMDGMNKLRTFLNRCKERNVILKMAKSWIGFQEVKFFGYTCRHNNYEVSKEKLVAFDSLSCPSTIKQARSALGMGVMFASFIPHYSTIAAPISDMTKKTFNWDKNTWEGNYYPEQFAKFVECIKGACTLFFPDYSCEWILRTDASELGVAAVLLQISKEDSSILQPIGIVSRKFSVQATKWPTIEQECYGIYYGVYSFSYLLVGKEFVIETDHNNLRWIEKSQVAKIIRWRIYIQGFNCKIRHIKGKLNTVSDWFSRNFGELNQLMEQAAGQKWELHNVLESFGTISDYLNYIVEIWEEGQSACNSLDDKYVCIHNVQESSGDEYAISSKGQETLTSHECFAKVHNAQVGHVGAKRTWNRLNQKYPGHRISFEGVTDMVGDCPVCIKYRLGMDTVLEPIIRTLKPEEHRSAIGFDALEISPKGANGETHIGACINLFTKHVFLQAMKGDNAENIATIIWQYWCNFGWTDKIISDKGPDLTSKLFEQLTKLSGIRHVFSITNKHANGCERILKEVQRHLRALVAEDPEGNMDVFKDPTWIPSAQMILNEEASSETGNFSPFALTFGNVDQPYGSVRHNNNLGRCQQYVTKLNANLKTLRERSSKYQEAIIKNRADKGPSPEKQNQFQATDLVLFDNGPKPKPKMSSRYSGPVEVIAQHKNDVTTRSLIDGKTTEYSVEDLKLYTGPRDMALDLALRGKSQHYVDAIIGYKGEPDHRTSLKFILQYSDGTTGPKSYDDDIYKTEAYETFCKSKPHLYHLTMRQKDAKKWISKFKYQEITSLSPGEIVYVNLRYYGDIWFQGLRLPDEHDIEYVLTFKCTNWNNRTHTKLTVENQTEGFNLDRFPWNNYDVFAWGHTKSLDQTKHTLISRELIQRFPNILGSG